ncbi:MAG: DUF3500 domain-containing protein [Acidobacteriota bacterium]|jgi:hypothetical protein
MDRRQALRLTLRGGIALGVLGGAGLYGRYRYLPPAPSPRLDPVDDLAARLFRSLDGSLREAACVPYDHPYRQYHNRGVAGGGVDIDGDRFSWEQRSLLTDLLHAALSGPGRERLTRQFFIRWPGVQGLRLLICGEPGASAYQIVLSGPHLNLRIGGVSREGVAFGGPLVYGDQRGDSRQGLPRNVYRYQFLAAQRLFRTLEPEHRRAAILPRAPIQTRIELQGRHGTFPGVPIAALADPGKALARELVEGILSTYPARDVAYAWRCMEENGGLDALFLSYYEDGEVGGSGEYQIFRVEGPGAVFYFRGFPHVHAFVNVALDGDHPLSVGEIIGTNPAVLEGSAVKTLFQDAMRGQTGADLAYYPTESAVGRLRPGIVRTGDIYTLESWQDRIVTAPVRGDGIAGPLREELERAGGLPAAGRTCALATTAHAAREVAPGGSWQEAMLLRDAAIAHLREQGFGRRA